MSHTYTIISNLHIHVTTLTFQNHEYINTQTFIKSLCIRMSSLYQFKSTYINTHTNTPLVIFKYNVTTLTFQNHAYINTQTCYKVSMYKNAISLTV